MTARSKTRSWAVFSIVLLLAFTCDVAAAAVRRESLTQIAGKWAVTQAYCRAYLRGKLDKESEAKASWSGLLGIDRSGNIEWAYVPQSCDAKKVQKSGNLFKIEAECEYHAVPYDVSISIRAEDKKTIEMVFSNKNFPMYGRTVFTKCSSD